LRAHPGVPGVPVRGDGFAALQPTAAEVLHLRKMVNDLEAELAATDRN
jgi:hypothetical protein